MNKQTLKQKEDAIYNVLRFIINIGFAISISSATYFLSRRKIIINKIPVSNTSASVRIFSYILFFVTILWFISYLYTVISELELMHLFFDHKATELNKTLFKESFSFKNLLIVSGLSLSFGILISYTSNLIIYCTTVVIFEIFDIVGGLSIKKSLLYYRNDESYANNKKQKIILDYYLSNPTLSRVITIFVLFLISLCFSVIYFYYKFIILEYVTYILLIITITVGEIVIWRWRSVRNKKLGIQN